MAIIFPLNIGLFMLPPTRNDALNDEELDKLTTAIVKVAAVNKYVERAILDGAAGGAYVELAMVVGAIAVRRAARHGLLPAGLDAAVGQQLGMGEAPEPTPNGTAPDVGAPWVDAAVPVA
jgi:hypothetical protein